MNNSKIKVGITGQAGYIGTYLFNYFGLQENLERVNFQDEFFNNPDSLDSFVRQCDVIVHLAALNRHSEPGVIYNTNLRLINQLIAAMKRTDSSPHLLISSSTQETRDNEYGRSKKEGRELLAAFCNTNGNKFTGLVIPNVFGPFGRPFYNSVVSTFAHQLINNETPIIQTDVTLNLIYINDLIKRIYRIIVTKEYNPQLFISPIGEATVSEILTKFQSFQTVYKENGIFPDLSSYLDLCLFNTYRSYLPTDFALRNYELHEDERGSFVEVIKSKNCGQTSFSTTKPGITRGNHFHQRKIERFSVIKGEALIQLRRIGTDEIIEYKLSGKNPGYVDMPVWCTHNITNIGDTDLYTMFWISEFYESKDPDTHYEKV